MCNNTQKKKAAGAGKDFTLFFGVMLHFNFKCVSRFGRGTKRNSYRKTCNKIAKKQKRPRLEKYKTKKRCYHYVLNIE